MSALRSSTLRLRTAAMKFAEVASARPALDLDLAPRCASGTGLGLPLGIELALLIDDHALFEMGDVADRLTRGNPWSSGRGPRR